MVSRSQFPLFESLLAGLAASVTVASWIFPASPSLAPVYQPLMLKLSLSWLLWRCFLLHRRLKERHAWHRSPLWRLSPQCLGRSPTADPMLGRGFLWTDRHTEALEAEIRAVGALPVAPPPRGGTAALHAVGRQEEELVPLPWTEMVGQMGIFGANRSGKSTLMEALLVQVIAHD